MDDADIIRSDKPNTVASLTDKVIQIVSAGGHDASFPVVTREGEALRLQGVIAVNELEHALGKRFSCVAFILLLSFLSFC